MEKETKIIPVKKKKPNKTKANIQPKDKRKKRKIEFSKVLVTWALSLTTVCVGLSYALALFDHNPCSEVTTAVVTTCVAIGVAYQAKSYGEKNSRNKYGVDENGHKQSASGSDDSGAVG